MKTDKEILDFYGVELGKTYKVINQADGEFEGNYVNKVFEVVKECDELWFKNKHDSTCVFHIRILRYFDYEEVKLEILDEKEKKYLSTVIAPFKERVISITKCKSMFVEKEYLNFKLIEDDNCVLPYFDINTMYKGMTVSHAYTLKELNL